MIRKIIAIIAAIVINCAVLAWFHAWSPTAVAYTPSPEKAQPTPTLPTLHVYPSAAQLRELRKEHARAPASPAQANAGAGIACLAMPYYSFATQCDAAVSG